MTNRGNFRVPALQRTVDRAGALQYHRRFTRHQWLSHPAAYEAVFHADAHRLNPSHKPGREHPNNFLPKIAKD
ncbi:hypothetical protein CBM2587_A90026 [Cupriavidus taiwanensis]|uniref:Uncharacterized protein n=1 Tax=Cupriavidus taiwanensis TaxID=164546 RepID=A0A375BWT4_9BURK|nr:hypothetical protein CBM2587_A90026 [Cupriavidus taiwanensis]